MADGFDSDVIAAMHETALDMTESGVVPRHAMKAFGESFPVPVDELAPERIREIRLREEVSQAVFARYLNVTKSLVSKWERGEKRPSGPSMKLLSLVARNGLSAVA